MIKREGSKIKTANGRKVDRKILKAMVIKETGKKNQYQPTYRLPPGQPCKDRRKPSATFPDTLALRCSHRGKILVRIPKPKKRGKRATGTWMTKKT